MVNIELLRSLSTIKKYPEGSVIVTEGEAGNEMYFILSGKVAVYLNTFSDHAFEICELGPGEIFGEMSLLEDMPRSATIVALEPLNVLAVDKEHFEIFLSNQPQMALKLMKSLSGRLRSTHRKLIELNHSPLPEQQAVEINSSRSTSGNAEKGTVITLTELFPPEHKVYNYQPTFDPFGYIFEKVVACPICGSKFVTYAQKISKLRSQGIDDDLRRRYENFDPLWYNLWTCPDCYYSNYHSEFSGIPLSKHSLITEKLKAALKGEKPQLDKDKDINQLFAAYYLLLSGAKAVAAPNIKLGKIWMNLLWLYRDCQDEEMIKIASENALGYYEEAYLNSDMDLKPEDEQQLCLILAELYLTIGKTDEGHKYLMRARSQRPGNKAFSEIAERRLEELKNSK